MKILYLDIETSPVLGWVWGAYEQNVLDIVQDWKLLGLAYAWNDDKVKAVYPPKARYKEWKQCEHELVEKVHRLMDEADVVIAHHGDRFDLPKLNAKFVEYRLGPVSPYLSIDTKKIASREFKFTRNNLGEVGKLLGLGDKIHNSGFDMWLGCMAGEPAAWKEMREYNIRDVDLLREVYKVLAPYDRQHPNVGMGHSCSKCGSADLMKRGTKLMRSGLERQVYQCKECGGYSSALKNGQIRP